VLENYRRLQKLTPENCTQNWLRNGVTENAGVDNVIRSKMQALQGWKCRSGKYGSIIGSRGGKYRSRLAVWKAEPILYSDTALSYFLKLPLDF